MKFCINELYCPITGIYFVIAVSIDQAVLVLNDALSNIPMSSSLMPTSQTRCKRVIVLISTVTANVVTP